LIDFHCHILPALDDGPDDIDESVAMAAALRDAGYRAVYCTPHLIRGSFDADNGAVKSAVSMLQERLKAENIDLEIFPGREYYMDEFLAGYLKDPLPLGETRYIMVEISNHASAEFVKETCFRIKCFGFTPMIAHPERCRLFAMPKKINGIQSWFSGPKKKDSKQPASSLLEYLKEIDCAFQGNLGSFEGLYGSEVRQTANYLKKNEIFTHFGTDAHSLRSVKRLGLEGWTG